MDPTKVTTLPSAFHIETRKPMADRDIEEAADHAAGRGDTTRSDPAVIEAAKEAILDAWGVRRVSARLGQNAHVAAEAAAAVLVPATAEQIAWDIEQMPDQEYTLTELKAEGFADDLGVIYRDARGNAAARARSFAAGLSAGATGGDDDD